VSVKGVIVSLENLFIKIVNFPEKFVLLTVRKFRFMLIGASLVCVCVFLSKCKQRIPEKLFKRSWKGIKNLNFLKRIRHFRIIVLCKCVCVCVYEMMDVCVCNQIKII